jgi:hypothetical protein
MAKYSMKKGGKEVGPASTYAEPHTMQGGKPDLAPAGYGASDRQKVQELHMSVGNITNRDYEPTETTGIKIRGTGAATKGVMARGPMA